MTKPTYEELAAQVERLRDYVMRGSPWNTNPEKCERGLVLSETPADSLAALKAQWQAEALDQCVKSCKLRVFDGPDIYSEAVLEFARELIQNTGANK